MDRENLLIDLDHMLFLLSDYLCREGDTCLMKDSEVRKELEKAKKIISDVCKKLRG